jgi:phosphatidylglycerol:prolipoprotein diacylglycerol transferase
VVFHDGIPRHPTQLYEAAFHASAAVFLAWAGRRGLFRLQRIKLYIMAYLVYRFFTEFIRPEPVAALGLTAYQWGALVLLPVFAWLWRRDARAKGISPESLMSHQDPDIDAPDVPRRSG